MSVIDRRQFFIADFPFQRDDFKHIELKCGKIISYHKDLKVQIAGDNVLIGYAYRVDKVAEIDIASVKYTDRRNISGRFVLITDNLMYMDACGTLGLCYGFDKALHICVSSSLHLMKEALNCELISNYKVSYGDGHGILDYYPIPYTPLDGIWKLLPSQYIDLSNSRILQLDDYFSRRYKDKPLEWLQNRFTDEFVTLLKNIEREFGTEIWLPLTAGVDSRTILALLLKSGVQFSAYTSLRDNTKPNDRKIPLRLCKKIKVPHFYFDERGHSVKEREKIFDVHSSGFIVGTERKQYLTGVDVPIERKAIVLWGTVWAGYIKPYQKIFLQNEDAESCLEQINAVSGGILDRSNIHRLSLHTWLTNVFNHPIPDIDWRERMYIEQRNGAWVSGAMQAIDLFDSVRVAPVNSQELLEILLSADVAPGDKGFQKKIISDCCLKIGKMPYGGEHKRIVRRIARKIVRLRGIK